MAGITNKRGKMFRQSRNKLGRFLKNYVPWNKKEIAWIGVGLVVLFFGVSLLIPEKIVSNGSATNIFAHFVGFVIGFLLMLIFNSFHIKTLRCNFLN
ncbi:MAG: hypothetical protein V1886_00075 [archaeon]